MGTEALTKPLRQTAYGKEVSDVQIGLEQLKLNC